jgi:hypothetical protein
MCGRDLSYPVLPVTDYLHEICSSSISRKTPVFRCHLPLLSPSPLTPDLQAHRHPGDRVLSGSAALPSLRDRLRRPSAPLRKSRTGERHARRSEDSVPFMPHADRSAVGWSLRSLNEGFCSSRSPYHCGGTSPAKIGLIGFAFGEIVISPPDPRRGNLPLLFRLLPLAGKEKRGVVGG